MKKDYVLWCLITIGVMMITISSLSDDHQAKEEKRSISSTPEDGRILSINSRRVNVNLGRLDGVRRGMTLEIYRPKILYDANADLTQTIKTPLGMGLVIDVDQNRSTLYLSDFEVTTDDRSKTSPPLIDIGTNIRLVRLPAKCLLVLGRHSILVRKFEGAGSDIEERLAETETNQLAASLDNGPQVPFKPDQEINLVDADGNEISVAFGKNAGEGIASFELLHKIDREVIIVPGIESKPQHVVGIYDRIKRPPQNLVGQLQKSLLGNAMIIAIRGDILQMTGINPNKVESGNKLTLSKTPKEIIHPVTGQMIKLGVMRELTGVVSAVSDNLVELSIPPKSSKGFFVDDTISVTKN